MANFWNKIKDIFQPESESIKEEIDLSYDHDIPLDEKFVNFFSKADGHFLYCENQSEALKYIQQIIDVERVSRFICFDEELQKMLNTLSANYINYPSATADFNFLNCENLIAYNGSIVLSSDVTSGRKLSELPDNFIIYARHEQIVTNLSEAMQIFNRRKTAGMPSGITSIGGIDADPLNGQVSTKNIYLLLVE